MVDREHEGPERSGHVPAYAILALFFLLLVDIFGGWLPLPEWAIMALAAGLSALVIAGLVGSRNFLYVLLFCVVFLNVLTGFRFLPDWVDIVANVVWVAIIPAAIWLLVREWRGSGDGGAGRGARRG